MAVFNSDRAGVIAAYSGLTLVGPATRPRVRVQFNGVIDFGSRVLSGCVSLKRPVQV